MQQTIKHICIFLLFLVVLTIWKEGEHTLSSILPHFYRESMTLFIWSTVVVVFWYLMFNYLGRMSNKVVYVTTAIIVIGALVYNDVINVF